MGSAWISRWSLGLSSNFGRWGDRTWQALKNHGALHDHTLAVIAYTGVKQGSPDSLCVVFVARSVLDELEKFDVAKEGLHIFIDGTWKKTELLRVMRALLNPDGLPAGRSVGFYKLSVGLAAGYITELRFKLYVFLLS